MGLKYVYGVVIQLTDTQDNKCTRNMLEEHQWYTSITLHAKGGWNMNIQHYTLLLQIGMSPTRENQVSMLKARCRVSINYSTSIIVDLVSHSLILDRPFSPARVIAQ